MKKLFVSALIAASAVTSVAAEDCIMAEELLVEFKNDSTRYAGDAETKKIAKFADFMKQSDLYALIEGHTSSYAPASYNIDLSGKRAAKVMQSLVAQGVEASHVRAMGFGETSPLYDNTTEEGAAKNRRVFAELFNSAEELDAYIKTEKARIRPLRNKEM